MSKQILNHSDRDKLSLYRNALAVLVERSGGHVSITYDELNRQSDLLNRPILDGYEFRAVQHARVPQ